MEGTQGKAIMPQSSRAKLFNVLDTLPKKGLQSGTTHASKTALAVWATRRYARSAVGLQAPMTNSSRTPDTPRSEAACCSDRPTLMAEESPGFHKQHLRQWENWCQAALAKVNPKAQQWLMCKSIRRWTNHFGPDGEIVPGGRQPGESIPCEHQEGKQKSRGQSSLTEASRGDSKAPPDMPKQIQGVLARPSRHNTRRIGHEQKSHT